MRKIAFTKMVASGNDFVLMNYDVGCTKYDLRNLARRICSRKYGIGADGLLILGKSRRADVRMRIFNADGSEAEMCGNGARCAALYATRYTLSAKQALKIETKAGIIDSQIKGNSVKIKLTGPKDIKLNIPITVNNRLLHVDYINTGVPHTIVFVEGLDRIDVALLGRAIRNHSQFKPQGTNVDFVEVLDKGAIKVRTYERGVEDETLACGTGAAASALLYAIRYTLSAISKLNVQTSGGELLKVYFRREENKFKDVWLEGRVKIICKGEFYV